ncbi:MAG: alanine racemase [Acidimicrobiia bacterium]|nr:alanine racemase [Acidimicrobiia bacterium]
MKAFKSTELARRLAEAGHRNFCSRDTRRGGRHGAGGAGRRPAPRQRGGRSRNAWPSWPDSLAGSRPATVAVDSVETIMAAAEARIGEVLVDVNVGMPRCGCDPTTWRNGSPTWHASLGMGVRGVMGYEGHIVGNADRAWREEQVGVAMGALERAHGLVGGEIVSAGGTGTYDINTWATEIQAGSFVLMDTAYGKLDLPFRQGLFLLTTVLSVSEGWAVNDGGLKSLGMDHGDPEMDHATVFFCSDEHITFVPDTDHPVQVGDRLRVTPAHIDPTIARHEWLHVVDGDEVVDRWSVDLRHW